MNLDNLRRWAAALKQNIFALYLASKDPLTPILAKSVIALTVGYALSPIDLIPDFIPVIGYLDDLLLLPAGIWLAIRLIPEPVWQECKTWAATESFALPKSRGAAVVVVLLWLLLCVWVFYWWSAT